VEPVKNPLRESAACNFLISRAVETNQTRSTFYQEDPCELGEQVIDEVLIYLQLKISKGSGYSA
jgi:hypothetical protein